MDRGEPPASGRGVFVSYADEDRARVRPLVERIARRETVWWDQRLEPGAAFRDVIREQLDRAACVVVVWTQRSVAKPFVRSEAERAFARGVLVPVKLDRKADVPLPFTELHHADLDGWDGRDSPELRALLRKIGALTRGGASPPSYHGFLQDGGWPVDASQSATGELRSLTKRLRALGEILVSEEGAARDLGVALAEVEKTYRAVGRAIAAYVAPGVARGAIDPKPYVAMERGSLLAMIERGRGHCSRIATLYGRFGGVRDAIRDEVSAKTLEEADATIGRLATADGDLFAMLAAIGDVLTNESRAIVNLLAAGEKKLARDRILSGRVRLQPLEDQLATALSELREAQRALGYAATA